MYNSQFQFFPLVLDKKFVKSLYYEVPVVVDAVPDEGNVTG
jgi:hypothetical protein